MWSRSTAWPGPFARPRRQRAEADLAGSLGEFAGGGRARQAAEAIAAFESPGSHSSQVFPENSARGSEARGCP
jgi:hypothetical protein